MKLKAFKTPGFLLLFLVFFGWSYGQTNKHLRYEDDNPAVFLLHDGFVVYYDSVHKTPAYTLHCASIEQVRDSTITPLERSKTFYRDDALPNSIASYPYDFKKSGYDRGHHAPAGDFRYSRKLKDESFLMSNISPQSPALNRKALVNIEHWIRNQIKTNRHSAWVVTGSLYLNDSTKRLGVHAVGVPSHIYKVAYFPNQERIYCWLLDNRVATFPPNHSNFQVSLQGIEKLSGFSFFEKSNIHHYNQ